jgi:cell wall-associated NlpC family hydrolase
MTASPQLQTAEHWAVPLIGKPFESQARGPGKFDCWGLLWWVYKTRFNLELPLFSCVPAYDTTLVSTTIDCERQTWERVEQPRDGDAVLMGRTKRYHHVGIWAEVDGGLVVHAFRTQVVAQSLSAVRRCGISHYAFYRHGSNQRTVQPIQT